MAPSNLNSQPSESALREALAHLYQDSTSLDRAVQELAAAGAISEGITADSQLVEAVDLDLDRAKRCGFPEVVFGEGKSSELIVQIFQKQQKAGQDSLVTRVRAEHVAKIRAQFPDSHYNEVARTIRLRHSSTIAETQGGPVFVVTAGSSDRAVAEEAMETLLWMRVNCELIQDVGVAGPHRLQKHVARLQTATAIVCVAGMEAALPSVVGGYVGCPVIGVPTSVGYGASLQGITAMLSMLTCCASNVVCVNIDAGFKGGYVAGLIATRSKM